MSNATPDVSVLGTRRCKEQACTVAENGECYEGITDFTTCPNYVSFGSADEVDDTELFDEDDDENVTPEITASSVDLYGGKELDYAGSLRITLDALTKVIVLAGPNDSGKTTLLASIFEHFFDEPLGGYLFAGSETLPAFDRRCHLSRTDSQRRTEDTERTKSQSEQTMLHLRVRDEALKKRAQELLFSDIRGELFKEAIKSKAEAQRIKVLKRADHLALLIDGERLSDLTSRNQAATSAKMTLRSFIEAEMIGKQTCVDVLFTKDDLMRATDPANETGKFLEVIEDEIKKRHEHQLGRLRFHRVAARTTEGTDSYGLPKLFCGWVEESAYTRLRASGTRGESPRVVTSSREFDLYAAKLLPRQFVAREAASA